MKATALALLTAVAGFGVTAARADSHVSFGIGIHSGPVYRPAVPAYAPPPVVVAPRGHWENVTRRIWVPARWIESRNAWGRPVRVLEPAHYAYTTNRVWVEAPRYDRYDYRGDWRHDNRHHWNRGYRR